MTAPARGNRTPWVILAVMFVLLVLVAYDDWQHPATVSRVWTVPGGAMTCYTIEGRPGVTCAR